MVVSPTRVQDFLIDADYPAEKEDLINYAEENAADEEILDVLQRIPDDTYETPADVGEAVADLDDADIDTDILIDNEEDEEEIGY